MVLKVMFITVFRSKETNNWNSGISNRMMYIAPIDS